MQFVHPPAEQHLHDHKGSLSFFYTPPEINNSHFREFFAAYWFMYHPSKNGSYPPPKLLEDWKKLFEESPSCLSNLSLSALYAYYENLAFNVFQEKRSEIWTFFCTQILSKWEQKENDQLTLFYKLFVIIEEILEEAGPENKKWNILFPPFEEFLNKHTVTDIEHFYALLIPGRRSSLYLVEILINCLEKKEGWREQLGSINHWIFKKIYSPSFKNLLNFDLKGLSKDFTEEFIKRLDTVIKDGRDKENNKDKIQNLQLLFSLQWHEILKPSYTLTYLKREYHSIWHYLLKLNEVNWSKRGQIPPLILYHLFIIMRAVHRKDAEIATYVYQLFELFRQASLEDLTFFFSQVIEHNNKPYYLGLAIIDYWKDPDNQQLKDSLLVWLFKKNHSFVIKEIFLEAPYKPYFTMDYLKNLANNLLNIPYSNLLTPKITHFIYSLSRETEITQALIEEIKDIYCVYCEEHKGKQDIFYENNPWISFAQYLSGYGLIEKNYYRLLIPHCPFVDPVSCEKFIAYSPQFLVPSERGDELLLCENIRKYYDAYGAWNSGTRPLSDIERRYFLAKYPHYQEKTAKRNLPVKPLTIDTVDMLLELVNLSIYSSGFKAGGVYCGKESSIARSAFKRFVKQLHRMEPDERENLLHHPIYFEVDHTFEEIWTKIVYKKECMVKHGRILVALILEYNPLAEFSQSIYKNMDLSQLQSKSAKLSYREISASKAMERLIMLVVSLLTHSFTVSGGETIKFWDNENTVPKTGFAIFNLIFPILSFANCENIMDVYRKIATVVEGALNQRSYMTLTRRIDTHEWLTAIHNRSFYRAEENDCFSSEVLISVLWEDASEKLREKSKVFIEELIRTEVQNKNSVYKKIRVNIYFKKWLNIHRDIAETVLDKLGETEKPKLDISSLIINYLLDQTSDQLPLFFDEKTYIFKLDGENETPKKLEKSISLKQTISKFLNVLLLNLQEIAEQAEKDQLVQTINSLLSPIPSSGTSLPDLRLYSDKEEGRITGCPETLFSAEITLQNSGKLTVQSKLF